MMGPSKWCAAVTARIVLFGVALASLSCTMITIHHVPSPAPVTDDVLVAGVGRADLTPPAGYPLYGYSATSEQVARGVESRLYARALYIQGTNGEAVALVQCDLGAISALLHRQVAAILAPYTGLGPDRVLMATTHTHSAPGGYFEAPFYNKFGGHEGGFDPGLLAFLSERIAAAVRTAYETRSPARVAVGRCTIEGVTYNRSLPAHDANFHGHHHDPAFDAGDAVNRQFTMMRIDRVTADGTSPLGAFTNFAIHGTAIGPENDLYSSDCHGAAERYLESAIRSQYGLPDSVEVVHLLTNGMAGDAAPAFDRSKRGFAEAHRLGRVIADSAFSLFRALGDSLRDTLVVERAYREIDLRQTVESVDGSELLPPRLGFPVLGGTEDGFSPLRALWPGSEGTRAHSADFAWGGVGFSAFLGPFSWNAMDSAKVWAGGGLHDHLLPTYDFPEFMTLQVMRLGELLVLAVPGEITTTMGLRVAAACSTAAAIERDIRHTFISSLTNQYMSYFSTPAEYNAQHYEGAHTLWGPHSGDFVRDELADLCRRLGQEAAVEVPHQWTFRPGQKYRFAEFGPSSATPLSAEPGAATDLGADERADCYWWDEPPSRLCLDQVNWRVEVPDAAQGWTVLRRAGLASDTDLTVDEHGLELIVMLCNKDERRSFREASPGTAQPKGKHLWCVHWNAPTPDRPPRFRLALYVGAASNPLITREFTVAAGGR